MSVWDNLSAVLIIFVAILSIANNDWMWLGVSLLGLALFIYSKKKGATLEYNRFLIAMTIIPLAAQSVLGIYRFYEWNDSIWIISLTFQTWICVVYGYMLALLIDKATDIVLSKRWILLFSLLFAVSVSGIYLFLQFTSLYYQGFPVYNYDLAGLESTETRLWMNMRLMTPPAVAVPISIFIALVLRQWTKKTDKSELITEGAVNE